MYNIIDRKDDERVYKNSVTGTTVTTVRVITDKAGHTWWKFKDLLDIPFIRKKAAEHVTHLYGLGLTKLDVESFITGMKETLKDSGEDKYEHAYAKLLQFESVVSSSDPIQQSLGLCTVYFLLDDEPVDAWDMSIATRKMNMISLDPQLQSFFLNALIGGMNNLEAHYKNTMGIASVEKGLNSLESQTT